MTTYGRTNAVTAGGGTPTPTQTKEVQATAFPTVVTPDSGYTLSQATVTAPANLSAENIKTGVTIAGVEGSFVGEPYPVTDAQSAFWAKVASDPNMNDPISTPEGGLTIERIKDYAMCGIYIGPSGIDLTSIIGGGMFCFYKATQKYVNSEGTPTVGGPIKIKYLAESIFESAKLVDFPGGSWTTNTSSIYPFRNTSFYNDVSLPAERVYNGKIPNYFATNITKMSPNSSSTGSLTLTLPNNVTEIGNSAISGGYSTKLNLIMLATVPPTLTASNSLGNIKSITVPKGSLEAYRTATNWSKFADAMVEATE